MGFYKKNTKINQEGLLDIFKKKPVEIQYRLTKQGKDKLKKKLEQEQKALANILKKDKVTESFRSYSLDFGPVTYDRTPKKEYDDMLLDNKYDINYIPNGLLFLGEYGNITYDDFDKFDAYLKKYNYALEGGSATTDSGIIGIMIDKSFFKENTDYTVYNPNGVNQEDADIALPEDDNASDIDAIEATTAEIEFENTVEDSEELDELADRVDESLEKVEESLKSPEEVEVIDVAVVNESLNHYFRALGLPRENIGISTEAIKQNPVANLEAIKVELEGLGSKIKEYATAAWKKIVELFKKLVEYLTEVFNRTKFRVKRLLTTRLVEPSKEIDFMDNERLIFAFGAEWLEATLGEVCNHIAKATLTSIQNVIKLPKDQEGLDKLKEIRAKEFDNYNKDFLIGTNANSYLIKYNGIISPDFRQGIKKEAKLIYAYPSNNGGGELGINLIYAQPDDFYVLAKSSLRDSVEKFMELFKKVESNYKNPKFLENLLKKMQGFEEPRKQFLQEIASVGIGVSNELDKLEKDTELSPRVNNTFRKTYESFKTNLQIVLNLANGYGKITDVLLKYIERNFANKQ